MICFLLHISHLNSPGTITEYLSDPQPPLVVGGLAGRHGEVELSAAVLHSNSFNEEFQWKDSKKNF